MHRYALIVAGGSGTRMGVEIPKQFITIGNKPILMHTIQKFVGLTTQIDIVLVLPKNQIDKWFELCKEYNFKIEHKIVVGGETRFHSVKNGLNEIVIPDSIVAIHDGVRPFVTQKVIEECYKVAEKLRNAIPVIKPVESVRMENSSGSYPVDRNSVYLVQTPQVFQSAIIKECYQTAFQPSYTDDASVAEFHGIKINLVDGNRENIKITSPLDLKIAESILLDT